MNTILTFNAKKLALAIIAALAAASPLVQAQSPEDDVEVVRVWGTQIKASSLFLKQEAIADKQADHISDLLRIIPGIDVGGAHSLNQRITIRSMDDKDLLITIDGARQNSYMYHHMGNLQIHADILRSVDIDVGTNSAINGGLGGAVRFETKDAKDLLSGDQRIGVRINAGAGDNIGQSYSGTAYGYLTDSTDFLLYYNRVNRDNYDVGGGRILDENGAEIPGTNGEVVGLEGDLEDTLIKLGWDINASQRLQFGYERYTDEGDYSFRPDMGLATDLAITESLMVPLLWPTELTRDTATLNYELMLDNTVIKATLYNNKSELFRDESGWSQSPSPRFQGNAALVTGEAVNTGATILVNSYFDISEFETNTTYGVDYVKYDTDYVSERASGDLTSDESSTMLALFAESAINLSDTVTFTPGIRYESYEAETTVINDDFDDVLLALSASYQPNDDLVFEISAAELFQGPEVGEVFIGAGLFDVPNPDIEEETGLNMEFSFAYQSSLNENSVISVGGTFFRTQIDNYIFDYAPPPNTVMARSWKDNIGDMEIDGFETYVEYEYEGFNILATFSRAESELDAFAEYSSLQGARLDRQQGDTISLVAHYEFDNPGLVLNWEMLNVDDVDAGIDLDGASLDNSKDGFTVHNVSARWEPQSIQGLTFIAGVDNLFDEFFASQSSRTGTSFHPVFGPLYLLDYEPGRNIKLTISYQY
ncbi:MAG: TonB-dependent receptor [Pseudomonadota bacterium]